LIILEKYDRPLFAAKSLTHINNISEDLCSHNLNVILLEISRNVTAYICQNKLRIIENRKLNTY